MRIDLDPQPGTDFDDARTGRGRRPRTARRGRATSGYPKTSGGRGIHIYVRLQTRWTFTEIRRAVLAFSREIERRIPDAGDHEMVEGGTRRQGVPRLQPERARPDDRGCVQRARESAGHGVDAGHVAANWQTSSRTTSRSTRCRSGSRRSATCTPRIDDVAHDLTPLVEMADRDERDRGLGDAPYPPNFPKMEGEPARVQPSRAKKKD